MDLISVVERLHAPLSVVMLLVFCAIIGWTFAPQQRTRMDDSARIPLRDDG